MSKKPRLPSFKLNYQELNERLGRYCTEVQVLYDKLASSAAQKVLANTHYDGSSPFLFDAFPELAKTANDLQADFATSLKALVTSYTSKEWKQSNLLQDLVADKALAAYKAKIKGREQKIYYQPNSDALKAFQNRVSNGMNLSANIWQQSEGAMRELEGALSVSIEKGTDAKTVSKRVSKYLKDFPSLQKDYTEQFGKADNLHDCEYRSIRLARSEINMAYRSAEQERWKQFDFIKGYEVKTSGSHPQPDICDDLAGKYPKDFVFLGWHPNCMCYVVPIVMSEDEYWDYQDAKDDDPEAQPEGYVTETPSAFTSYVRANADKIQAATARGTAPYWVRDNAEYINAAEKGESGAAAKGGSSGAATKSTTGTALTSASGGGATPPAEPPTATAAAEQPQFTDKTLRNLYDTIENRYEETDPNLKARETEIKALMTKLFDKNDYGMIAKAKNLDSIIENGFLNQLETGTSGGALTTHDSLVGKIEPFNDRMVLSHLMFDGKNYEKYAQAGGFFGEQFERGEYEKYGLLLDGDKRVALRRQSNENYGNMQIRFKKDRVRTTWTFDDSYDTERYHSYFQPTLTSDPRVESFDKAIKDVDKFISQSKNVSSAAEWAEINNSKYIELQYHGKLTIDDVESITFKELPTNVIKEETITKLREKGIRIWYLNNEDKVVEFLPS